MLAFKIGLIIVMLYVVHQEEKELKELENKNKKYQKKIEKNSYIGRILKNIILGGK